MKWVLSAFLSILITSTMVASGATLLWEPFNGTDWSDITGLGWTKEGGSGTFNIRSDWPLDATSGQYAATDIGTWWEWTTYSKTFPAVTLGDNDRVIATISLRNGIRAWDKFILLGDTEYTLYRSLADYVYRCTDSKGGSSGDAGFSAPSWVDVTTDYMMIATKTQTLFYWKSHSAADWTPLWTSPNGMSTVSGIRFSVMGDRYNGEPYCYFQYDSVKVDVVPPLQKEFSVPAIKAIKVDGDLSDWPTSSEWSTDFVWWNGSPLASTTRAKFAYNDAADMLYVAIQTDEHSVQPGGLAVVGLSKNPAGNPIAGTDATQLSFELKPDGTVDIHNEIAAYHLNDNCITTGVTAGIKESGGVWTYEIAIPLWKVWTDASQGKETLAPGDAVYVYCVMQDAFQTINGTDMTYFGNPSFYSGAFNQAATLTLQPHPAGTGPLVNDPVVYYSFDNPADLGHDSSGHGYHAAVAQFPADSDPNTVITGTTNGYFGGAANFPKPLTLNPDNSYTYHNALVVPVINTADVPTSGFTIASWIYLDPNTTENYQLFAAEAGDGNQVVSAQIRIPASPGQPNTYRVILSADGGTTVKDLYLGPITQGAWVHFTGTYDQAANRVALYVNGQLLGSVPATENLPLAGNWNHGAKIGTTIGWARQFIGRMDEFYLFKRALAPVEIQMLAGAEIIPGDANGDGKVDVSDLGILAANYGGTGKTWPLGDFSGDGKVDVSDLGILAAHYGAGTGASLDFNADAKALGLIGDNNQPAAKEDTSVTSGLGCGSAGLPLIAGLLFAGLMLVKLKE